jgi:hypothetical protein
MNRYTVTAETRQAGAIGVFEKRTFTVTAPDIETAQAAALDELYRRNLEPRFISEIQQEPQQ